MKGKVQIPAILFFQMVLYVMNHEDNSDPRYRQIRRGIGQKMEAIHRHDLYTIYKTSHIPGKKEQARQEYLDSVGISPAFRWEESPDKQL